MRGMVNGNSIIAGAQAATMLATGPPSPSTGLNNTIVLNSCSSPATVVFPISSMRGDGMAATAVSSAPSLVDQTQVEAEWTGDMMTTRDLAVGTVAASATAVPTLRPPLEGQLKEVPQKIQLKKAITKLDAISEEMCSEIPFIAASEAVFSADLNSLRKTVAGTLMPRISALESVMTRQLGSSTNFVAQSQAQSQVPITVQANSTSASDSHPATALETSPSGRKEARTTSRVVSATGPSPQPSLQAKRSAACVSVPPHTVSGIPAVSKSAVMFHNRDGGDMIMRNTSHGSLMPAGQQGVTPSPKKATFLAHAPHSSVVRPRSVEMLSPNLLSLDLRPSAFNASGKADIPRLTGSSCGGMLPLGARLAASNVCRLPEHASGANPDMPSPQLQSRTMTAGSGRAAAPTSTESRALATATRMANVSLELQGVLRESTFSLERESTV